MATAMCTHRTLHQLWRRQMISRLDSHLIDARQRFVAMTFINLANTPSPFVDIENVLVVLAYDDHSSGNARIGRPPLWLAGYRASRVPQGVQWGGWQNSAYLKNVVLAPRAKAYGHRLDSKKADLLSLALKLDRRLSCAARYSAVPWPPLRLPRLWAGFQQCRLHKVQFAGPEFEAACCEASAT